MDIVDVHIYQGQWHWPLRNGTLADTLAVMDRYGMTQGVAMPVNGIAYDFVEANADLAEELSQQQRVFGYVMINGNYVDYAPDKTFSSPYFSGSYGDPRVTVIAGDRELVLDFS